MPLVYMKVCWNWERRMYLMLTLMPLSSIAVASLHDDDRSCLFFEFFLCGLIGGGLWLLSLFLVLV